MPGPAGAPYVTSAQLPNYAPAQLLALATSAQTDQACLDATAEADAFMTARYAMPLLAWPSDVTSHTAYIALHRIAAMVGYAPQAGSDNNIERNYYIAVGGCPFREPGYFPRIERQAMHPNVTPSIPIGQDPGHDAPQVQSDQPRGWQQYSRSGRPAVGGF
jgi:hypothetical protein